MLSQQDPYWKAFQRHTGPSHCRYVFLNLLTDSNKITHSDPASASCSCRSRRRAFTFSWFSEVICRVWRGTLASGFHLGRASPFLELLLLGLQRTHLPVTRTFTLSSQSSNRHNMDWTVKCLIKDDNDCEEFPLFYSIYQTFCWGKKTNLIRCLITKSGFTNSRILWEK